MKTDRLAWDSGWKNPTILEHLLTKDSQVPRLVALLTMLKLKVLASANGKRFDIIAS